MHKVPTFHIPMDKKLITEALNNSNFKVATKINYGLFYYSC